MKFGASFRTVSTNAKRPNRFPLLGNLKPNRLLLKDCPFMFGLGAFGLALKYSSALSQNSGTDET